MTIRVPARLRRCHDGCFKNNALPLLSLADAVVPAVRNDVPHTSSRISHVAAIPRNDVNVKVKHGLAGRFPHVDADVVSRRASASRSIMSRTIAMPPT